MLNMLWYLFRTQRKSNLQCLQYNITYILSLKIINTALKFQWKKHKCKSSLKKVLFCFSKVTKVIKVYKRLLSYCMINLTPHCIWTMSTANKGQREDYFFFFFFFLSSRGLMNSSKNWNCVLTIVITGISRRRKDQNENINRMLTPKLWRAQSLQLSFRFARANTIRQVESL